ncbi:MAG: hypothetical protein COA52_08595 [Hyphomicrobiales bacterium]|nr:MAG: hypothetical protein COA52_08595 [Hyphomicrobiales bacterium]
MKEFDAALNSTMQDYGYFQKQQGWLEPEAINAPILSDLQKPDGKHIGGIKQDVEFYRSTLDLAATQAIVVGHSMGGLLARVWASDYYNKEYRRPENFNQGDIDRLLTLNTPHFGSELMEMKDAISKGNIGEKNWHDWAEGFLVKTVLWWYFDPERGAVRDLQPGSKALKEIGKTDVPSYAIVTSATSGEIGTAEKDPLKHYNSLYTVAGQIFFNNQLLLDDFVEDRYKIWEQTPSKYRKNVTERFHSTDENRVGKKTNALDLTVPDNREKYKRLINRNINDNVFYWASMQDAEYQRSLGQSIENTIISPFGMLDVRMGSYQEKDYLDLELLSNDRLARSGAKQTIVSDYINEASKKVPLVFLSILRDLVFHQDPNTDAVVRVVSPWQNGLLDRINMAVARAGYQGGLITHHGPENQYNASPYIDYPILVFDPGSNESKSDASSYLIRQGPPGFRDIHFKRFVAEKARLGFNIWPNPHSEGWKWEFWSPFTIETGYDPRDRSNMPPYVEEAPAPETASSKAQIGLAKSVATTQQKSTVTAEQGGAIEKNIAVLAPAKPDPSEKEIKF